MSEVRDEGGENCRSPFAAPLYPQQHLYFARTRSLSIPLGSSTKVPCGSTAHVSADSGKDGCSREAARTESPSSILAVSSTVVLNKRIRHARTRDGTRCRKAERRVSQPDAKGDFLALNYVGGAFESNRGVDLHSSEAGMHTRTVSVFTFGGRFERFIKPGKD